MYIRPVLIQGKKVELIKKGETNKNVEIDKSVYVKRKNIAGEDY